MLVNKLRNLTKNKKGSEVVEKILMIVVSLAIGAAAVTFIWAAVNRASKPDAGNGSGITGGEISTPAGA